ncbi:MAG: molybdopterin biosynthesis protein [Planctomycetaceae bacterium]
MNSAAAQAARQQQFLQVLTRDEAEQRFRKHLRLQPLGTETVALSRALGRVAARDQTATVDVPGFDRSNVDGFALRSANTIGAAEETPIAFVLNAEVLSPGVRPSQPVLDGTATTIATGGMFPRGADAVVMIEHADVETAPDGVARLFIRRPAAPGDFVTFAGTDLSRGEVGVWQGQVLSAREIGILAAIGCAEVEVFRRPRVAILSTGDEVVPPGQPLPTGAVYDSNSYIVAATVEELGGEPVLLGCVPDEESQLEAALLRCLEQDVVVLSGGTSKGAGDLSYRVVSRLSDPGIVAHGVALKPGKPVCLAVTQGKPVVILPGFPTSAIFTFHEFLSPVIRALAGRPPEDRSHVMAQLPLQINSDRGRMEYNLVSLVDTAEGLAAYPIGKGSGSVTTFSHADGFIRIDQHTEIVPAGSDVEVTLLDRGLQPADLVVMGSHCLGLERLLSQLRTQGWRVKSLSIGSQGGLLAAQRGECDVAGMHLLDPQCGEYNRPFLDETLELLPGYQRMQCLIYRPGDRRFEGRTASDALQGIQVDADCLLVNRNPGSGTRILLDRLLDQTNWPRQQRPPGYAVQVKSHHAVAAAIAQQRADWGIAIDTVARDYGLAAIPLQAEHYDFVLPRSRRDRPAVRAFVQLLSDPEVQQQLQEMGLTPIRSSEFGADSPTT